MITVSFIPVGVGEVTVELTIPGDAGPAFVVFGVDGVNVDSAANVVSGAEAYLANVNGFAGLLPTVVSVSKITGRYRVDATTVQVAEAQVSIAGTNNQPPPPPQVASLFTKVSGLAGRQNRGRMYLPALEEGAIDNGGLYNASVFAVLGSRSDTFLTDMDTSGQAMHILHTSALIAATPVIALEASRKVATQRRRLR